MFAGERAIRLAVAAGVVLGLALAAQLWVGPVLAGVLLGAALVGCVASPRAGITLVLLTAPFRGAFVIEQLDCSVTRLIGIATVAGAVLGWAVQRRLPRLHRASWVLGGLVALAAASMIGGDAEPASWLIGAQYVALAVVIADLADSDRATVELTVVVCVSAMTAALMMLGDYLSFALAVRGEAPSRFEWWVDPQSTLLAAFFGAAAFAVLLVLSHSLSRRWRLAVWAMLIPPAIGVVVLTSRLTWLALVGGLLVHVLAGQQRGTRARRAAGVVGLIAGLALGSAVLGLWDPGMVHRVAHTADSAYEATSGRTVIWSVGAGIVADHPVRGIGIGRFPEVFEERRLASDPPIRSRPSRNAHSDPIGLAAELGLLGPVLLVWALVWMAAPLLRPDAGALAPAALGWLTYLTLLGLGLDMRDQWHVWVGYGIVMAISRSGPAARSRPGGTPG